MCSFSRKGSVCPGMRDILRNSGVDDPQPYGYRLVFLTTEHFIVVIDRDFVEP